MNNEIEELKNKLNLETRILLEIIDMIDGNKKKYYDYEENTLNELDFLKVEYELVKEAKVRLQNIFKN